MARKKQQSVAATGRRRAILSALAAVAVVAALAFGGRWMTLSNHAGPTLAVGGPFSLTDGDGRTVTDQDFRGRWMVVYFGYTFCPDICPTTLTLISAALDKLSPAEQAKVVPLFITVDPARDTPAVVKSYAAAFRPDMVGLTGTPDQLAPVEKEFKVYAVPVKGDDPANYTVDHSSVIYIVGPDGHTRALFAEGATVDKLAERLHDLLSS